MSSVKKTRKKQSSLEKQKKGTKTRNRIRTTSKTYSTLKKRDTPNKKVTKIKANSYSSSRNENKDVVLDEEKQFYTQ
jgi:hypothetical protein